VQIVLLVRGTIQHPSRPRRPATLLVQNGRQRRSRPSRKDLSRRVNLCGWRGEGNLEH
jgi:hypothetical protein